MNIRKGKLTGILVLLFLVCFEARGEPLRALVAGIHNVSLTDSEGVTVPLSYISSSVIKIEGDPRFYRGIQLELSVPQNFLAHRGSLAAALYGELDPSPDIGTVDVECRRLVLDPLPAKLRTIYQIPMKAGHGLKTTPYATVLTDVVQPSSFPLLFRLMPVIKGISSEVETMNFDLNVKAILSDEGALRIDVRYPDNLPGKPFTILIDDEVIENPAEERLLKEGGHHLVVLSENYRNQSSRFVIERAKILDLAVELLDTAPLVIFEYPENARVFLDNEPISDPGSPLPIEPGVHELRFQVSDYTITRSLTAQKGKTYRVALSIDVNISETE